MNLLRIELHKILPYRTVWIILGIFAALMLLILYASSSVTINGRAMGDEMYKLPEFWQTLTYTASFFNLLFGILIIILITDEFSFKTFRQQVIDGLSRAELVLAKFYVVLAFAALGTLFLFALGLYFGFIYGSDPSFEAFIGKIHFLFYYFLQAVGHMSMAMLFGFLIRRSGLAIIAFIAYSQIIEPLTHFRIPDNLDKYMPVKVLKSLTPMPGQEMLDQFTTPTGLLTPPGAALFAIAYITIFWLLSYLTLKVRDL